MMDSAPNTKMTFDLKSILDSLRNLWENDKRILIQYAVMTGCLLILVVFILFPLLFKVQPMKHQAGELGRTIAAAKIKIKKVPEAKQRIEVYSKELELVKKRFLKIRDLDELVGDLSKMAAGSEVVLAGSRPVSEKREPLPEPFDKRYLVVSYELVLAGGYHPFGRFLSELEQSEKLLLVSDFAIRSATTKQSGKLQATVQVEAFAQIPEGM